ncbi:MAG: ABC transporter substrate-binding protein [Patescibacteria group bacterium]|nr:ABC transporter substrate-binding protein [Patescibacteria group bacterium]
MDKIKLFIISTKNKINNIIDKIIGKIFTKRSDNILQDSLDKKLVLNLSKSHFPTLKQLRKLPHFLSNKERIIIKSLSVVICICAILLSINFYLNHIQVIPTVAGTYTEAIVGSPQYINPLFCQANNTDADLVKLIFSGLLKYDGETQKLKPDLCEKYEISEDQKTYIFYLRENLLWQDNEPLTADDVIFTVELSKYQKVKSLLGISFKGVKTEKINDRTLKFILEEPYAPFISVLTFGILPKHIWEEVSLTNINLAKYNLKPIGSGPYKADSFIKDEEGNIKSYLLTINDKYYSKKPLIKNLSLVFFSSYIEAVEALKTRSVQGLSFIPTEMEEELKNKEHLNNFSFPIQQYTALFLNQNKNDLLKNKEIRKALSLAVNQEKIIDDLLKNKANIVDGPILKTKWIDKENQKHIFNPEESKKLIESLKFIKNEDDKFYHKEITIDGEKEDKELTVIIVSANSKRNIEITEIIKKYWENIGVKTEIELLENPEIKNRIEEKNYEILLYGEMTGFDPDPYQFWHSSQNKKGGLNLSSFSNKKVDKLLEEALATNDVKIRKEKYNEFQKILNDETPAIFLYQPIYSYMIDNNIKGVKISNVIIPSDRFSNISDWYIKTKKQFYWKDKIE